MVVGENNTISQVLKTTKRVRCFKLGQFFSVNQVRSIDAPLCYLFPKSAPRRKGSENLCFTLHLRSHFFVPFVFHGATSTQLRAQSASIL